MQHTTKEEKVRGDMGMGESLSLPGLATELEGLRRRKHPSGQGLCAARASLHPAFPSRQR